MATSPRLAAISLAHERGAPCALTGGRVPMDPALGTALSLYNHHANVCRERLLKLRRTTDAYWRASYIDDIAFSSRQCRKQLPMVAPILLEALRATAPAMGRAAE